MNVDSEIIGSMAGILTTASFLPQAIKSIKAEDTKAISLMMYSMFTLGVFLWMVFGTMRDSRAMVVSNAITFTLALIILSKKIHNIIKKKD